MPYKNQEDKKRWEREHRAQRNAQRRRQRNTGINERIVEKEAPDPVKTGQTDSIWKTIVMCVVYIGLGLLTVFVNAKIHTPTDTNTSQGTSNSID